MERYQVLDAGERSETMQGILKENNQTWIMKITKKIWHSYICVSQQDSKISLVINRLLLNYK